MASFDASFRAVFRAIAGALPLAIVCLGITGRDVGWADPAQDAPPKPLAPVDWVEDPYAPHVTNGSEVRLGTAAGFLYGEGLDVLALGVTAAAGHRFGRLAIESEFDYLSLQAQGPDIRIGDGERLGALIRLDVLRFDSHWVGANSLLSVYVEGGAAVAWNHWYAVGPLEDARVVPDNTKRVEGQAGFGIEIDHRLQEPVGFPHRIGWFLGWRLAFAPEPVIGEACRGAVCPLAASQAAPLVAPQTATTPSVMEHLALRSMLFQSSLSITW